MRVVLALVVLLLSAMAMAAKENKVVALFLKSSDLCFKEKKLPPSYKAQFERYSYPNEPIVHEYLHCVSLNMGLWDDANGFKVEQIANLYKDRPKIDRIIPYLEACNRNANKDPASEWAYRAFKCILDSRIGEWFKEDAENQSSGK